VDFLIAASKLIGTTAPETNPRYGIGAMEIFKRLPATNCGRCGSPNCMEFAMRLFRRHVKPEECAPLMTPEFAACEGSLRWLLHVIGIQDLPVDPAPGNQ
jgi:ArsR family metal-binding transcriptional regulator